MTTFSVREALYSRAVAYIAMQQFSGSLISLTAVPVVQLVAHVWGRPVLLVAADVQEAAQVNE